MKTAKSIRWTLNMAALEFGVSPKTLSHATKSKGIVPHKKDGRFSTLQIAEAIFDDEHTHRTRLIKEQADLKETTNRVTKGELVCIQELATHMNRPLGAMKQRILGEPGMSPEGKDDLLSDIQELWACVFELKPKRKSVLALLKQASSYEEEKQKDTDGERNKASRAASIEKARGQNRKNPHVR